MSSRFFVLILASFLGFFVNADEEEPNISLRYVFDKYQKFKVVSNTGQTFLDRKLVKNQSLSLPFKDKNRKKIKTFTITLEDREYVLKTRCSSKQVKMAIGMDYFSVQSYAKKPACLISEKAITQPAKPKTVKEVRPAEQKTKSPLKAPDSSASQAN